VGDVIARLGDDVAHDIVGGAHLLERDDVAVAVGKPLAEARGLTS